jgi:hypothetical protein
MPERAEYKSNQSRDAASDAAVAYIQNIIANWCIVHGIQHALAWFGD